MNFLGGRKSGIKPVQPKIRIERTVEPKKPAPLPSKIALQKLAHAPRSKPSPSKSTTSSSRSSPALSDEYGMLRPQKRKARGRQSPSEPLLSSDSDDDDHSATLLDESASKRRRPDRPLDKKRRLRAEGLSHEDDGKFTLIHAAELTTAGTKSKVAQDAGIGEENVTVELQYPSASHRERYDLVFGKEQINPLDEILEVVNYVTNVYLTPEQAKVFKEPNNGIIRRITKARNLLIRDVLRRHLLEDFKQAVAVYNSAITELMRDGHLSKNLDSIHHLPLDMIQLIQKQIYDRSVSPQIDLLKQRHEKTENEKQTTYGEILPRFVSSALAKAGLMSDQVFVDLGSGVGNVVLQAALEFGCRSFGCEIVESACNIARAQMLEFDARCRLWGIRPGEYKLEQGSFFENQVTLDAVRRADVILVNNEVFDPETNGRLVQLFLDCKDGCKIISLQPFVDPGSQIKSRTENNPANQLRVEEHEYFNGWVSWKDAGGSYYIATKDSTRFQPRSK